MIIMAETTEVKDDGDRYKMPQVSYAVYLYDPDRLVQVASEVNGNDVEIKQGSTDETVGFDLMTSALPPDQEHKLRLFLVRRLRKGAIYAKTGNFSGMEFSLSDNVPAVCYYILLPCEARQLMLCLLAATDTNLEVFRPELSRFCERLTALIPADPEQPLPVSVSARLATWHSACLQYISRVLQALGPHVASLLQLAQQSGHIRGGARVSQALVDDMALFLESCTVAECLPSSQQEAELQRTDKNTYLVQGLRGNAYCNEWARLLLDLGHAAEPWRLRKVLEAFKLKTIKDMNVLKRLLKQAEMDHYSLYRAYTFLWQSGNSDVLLQQAKLEGGSAPDIISALEEHLTYCEA